MSLEDPSENVQKRAQEIEDARKKTNP